MSLDAYRGYDDAALALLANVGLVRRAAKLSVVLDGETATVDGNSVRLDPRGPAKATCGCPATGVCVHIIAATIAVRSLDAPTAAEPVDVLDELFATSPAAYCSAAGVAAVRAAQTREQTTATIEVDGARALIHLADRPTPIVFVAGGGFGGIVSDVAPAERGAVHLAALAAAFAATGRAWQWPVAATSTPVVVSRADTLDLAAACLTATLAAGLARASAESAERLDAVAVKARADGLPLLSRVLGRAAGLVGDLASRADSSSELEVALALADAWALVAALRIAQTPELVGEVRRASTETDSLDLMPLGARWFATPSGSRGISLVVGDRATRELHTVSTSRPAGSDPAFARNAHAILLFNSSVARIAAGAFRLSRPRLTPDGSLAASTTSRVDPAPPGFDADELLGFAVRRWTDLPPPPATVGFGVARGSAVLLAPVAVREPRIDEVAQQLVWPVVDADDEVLDLRVPLATHARGRADAIAAIVEARSKVRFILVHAEQSGREVSSVFLAEKAGLVLYPLDFIRPAAPKVSRLSALRSRLEKQFSTPHSTTAIVAPASTIDRVCSTVLDVLEQVSATGSARLSPRQIDVLRAQAALLGELALDALATAVSALAARDEVDVALVYRCLFLADRTRTLARAA